MFKGESQRPNHKEAELKSAVTRFPNVTEGKKSAAGIVVDRYFPHLRGLTETINNQDAWVGPVLPLYLSTEKNGERKTEFLVNFFSSEGINLPQGDKLGAYLGTISSYKWFSPSGKLTPEHLTSLVNLHLERLKSRPAAIKLIKEDGEDSSDALGEALKAMRSVKVDMETKISLSRLHKKRAEIIPDDLWLPVRNVIRASLTDNAPAIDQSFGTRYAALDSQKETPDEYVLADRNEEIIHAKLTMAAHLEQGASTVVAGLTKKKDAYTPLMAIYRHGLWPIGIVPGQQEKKRLPNPFKNTREYIVFSPRP